MTGPRSQAVAAPLPGGDVLIAGGLSGINMRSAIYKGLSSAELFDPRTKQFSGAGLGTMTTARAGAVATPLPDGDVLIAGGVNSRAELASAELFDPRTRRFSRAGLGKMTVARVYAVAAPLPNGDVLIAGGLNPRGRGLSSAELFDPRTKRFSGVGVGKMTVARYAAVAAPLPDGKVLIAGGSSNPSADWVSSAELFDPQTDRFSGAGVGSMTVARTRAVAAPLPSGKVLIAGGVAPGALWSSSAELFDSKSERFSSADVGSMTVPRADAVEARLPEGEVLIAGGIYEPLRWLSSAEEAR